MKSVNITPQPGYILCEPFIAKDKPFKSKEVTGEDQKSLVLAVGDAVIDSAKIERKQPCKVGDIILHADSNKTFEKDFLLYRFVHFSEVHGVIQPIEQEVEKTTGLSDKEVVTKNPGLYKKTK